MHYNPEWLRWHLGTICQSQSQAHFVCLLPSKTPCVSVVFQVPVVKCLTKAASRRAVWACSLRIWAIRGERHAGRNVGQLITVPRSWIRETNAAARLTVCFFIRVETWAHGVVLLLFISDPQFKLSEDILIDAPRSVFPWMYREVCYHGDSDDDQPVYCVTLSCVHVTCPDTQDWFLIACQENPISSHMCVNMDVCVCVCIYACVRASMYVCVILYFQVPFPEWVHFWFCCCSFLMALSAYSTTGLYLSPKCLLFT